MEARPSLKGPRLETAGGASHAACGNMLGPALRAAGATGPAATFRCDLIPKTLYMTIVFWFGANRRGTAIRKARTPAMRRAHRVAALAASPGDRRHRPSWRAPSTPPRGGHWPRPFAHSRDPPPVCRVPCRPTARRPAAAPLLLLMGFPVGGGKAAGISTPCGSMTTALRHCLCSPPTPSSTERNGNDAREKCNKLRACALPSHDARHCGRSRGERRPENV